MLDKMADDSPSQLSENNNSGSSPKNTTSNTLWAEGMDQRDPLLDDDAPPKDSIPIRVVPVTSCTNEFLDDTFTEKMSGANRRSLRSQYTLLQYDLTTAPFLDAMMGSEFSKSCKLMDRSLYTPLGLPLEPIGPLSQLLEAVNGQ